VASVQRFDVGRLDRAKRTGAGGARVPASVSRTGVQSYTDDQGRTVVTAPATKAGTVVGQQNQQLQQMEQQTNQDDPTAP